MRRVLVKSKDEIINLQLFLSDGVSEIYTEAVGGTGVNTTIWNVPEGEYVNQI